MTGLRQEIRDALANATPGPWHFFRNRHPNTDGTPWGTIESKRHPAGGAGTPLWARLTWSGRQAEADASLIVALRNNAEGLLAELDTVEQVAFRLLDGWNPGHHDDGHEVHALWFEEERTEPMSDAEDAVIAGMLPRLRGEPCPNHYEELRLAFRARLDTVEAERDAALAVALDQWEYAHADHCSNVLPCDRGEPYGCGCQWPKPPVLAALAADATPQPEEK